jgi:hypothetical protein
MNTDPRHPSETEQPSSDLRRLSHEIDEVVWFGRALIDNARARKRPSDKDKRCA